MRAKARTHRRDRYRIVRAEERRALRAACFCLAVGCAQACGPGSRDRPAAEVVDSAGVMIVVNTGEDAYLDWRFEAVVTLGGADDGPEAFHQIGDGGIDADAAGNLYILDRGNHQILVFDGEGRHVRTLGRQGGGPGEFQWPGTLVVWPDGATAVADVGKRGLVRFAPDGSPLAETPLVEGWFGGQVAVVKGDLVAQVHERQGETGHDRLLTLGDEPRLLVAMRSPPVRPVDFECVRISGMAQLFAPSLIWSAGPDFIATATGAEYVVDIYERDHKVASVRRTVELRPATHALALQEVGDDFRITFGGGGECRASAERVVDQRGVADVIPAVGNIAAAPDGTLWVRRGVVRGEDTSTDIFLARGEYLGTLAPGTPFPIAFMPNGNVVTVERDDLDVPRVVVYRIIGLRDEV